jgi:hypothetical protein
VTVFPVGLRGDATDAPTLQRIADGTGGLYAGATSASPPQSATTRISTHRYITPRRSAE